MSRRPLDLLLNDVLDAIDRTIHEYFGIDLQIIWQIVHADLPSLRETLSRI
jgi:uncharacterized protein with HEPN domain